MKWYFIALKRSFNFFGRSGRTEFWTFVLVTFVGAIGLNILAYLSLSEQIQGGELQGGPKEFSFFLTLANIFTLIHFIPWLSVFVRRIHDTGRSGIVALLINIIPIVGPLIVLYFLVSEGDGFDNNYGPPYLGELQRDGLDDLDDEFETVVDASRSTGRRSKMHNSNYTVSLNSRETQSFGRAQNIGKDQNFHTATTDNLEDETLMPNELSLDMTDPANKLLKNCKKKWYIYGKKKKYGPYDLQQIIEHLENNIIQQETFCREVNSENKIKISQIFEIKSYYAKKK